MRSPVIVENVRETRVRVEKEHRLSQNAPENSALLPAQ